MSGVSKFFIDRPIFAAVISVVIVIAGLVAVRTLPIAQYPEIAPPTVEVRCTYPGAGSPVVTVHGPKTNVHLNSGKRIACDLQDNSVH